MLLLCAYLEIGQLGYMKLFFTFALTLPPGRRRAKYNRKFTELSHKVSQPEYVCSVCPFPFQLTRELPGTDHIDVVGNPLRGKEDTKPFVALL